MSDVVVKTPGTRETLTTHDDTVFAGACVRATAAGETDYLPAEAYHPIKQVLDATNKRFGETYATGDEVECDTPPIGAHRMVRVHATSTQGALEFGDVLGHSTNGRLVKVSDTDDARGVAIARQAVAVNTTATILVEVI